MTASPAGRATHPAARATHVAGIRRRRGATLVCMGAVFILSLLVLGAAGPVSGHAQLVSVEPADGVIVERSPDEVRVTFNEPVGLASGGLQVVDASGQTLDAGEDIVDGSTVSQALPSLPDGWYLVTWGIVSEDGHVVRATSVFGVGEIDAGSRPSASERDTMAIGAGMARAAMDLALLVATGAWVAWWLLLARTTRVRRLAVSALAIALVVSLAWAVAQWLDGGQGWLETPAALATVVRLAAIAIALVAVSRSALVSALATVVALATMVGGGHAAGSSLASALLIVHLLAASAWLGTGPAVLLVLTDRGLDAERTLAVVRRFSTLAPIVLVTVGAAGAVLALILTEGFAGGLTTPWVLILASKVGLVAAAALVGLLARRRLRGSPTRSTMRRVFLVDAVLLPLIVVASAGLTLSGPHEGQAGHGTEGAGMAPVTCSIASEPLSLTLFVTPGAPGPNQLQVDGVPPTALDVGLELTTPTTSGAPIALAAEQLAEAWVAEGVLPIPGTWDVTVAVRVDTFTQVRGDCSIVLVDPSADHAGSHGSPAPSGLHGHP